MDEEEDGSIMECLFCLGDDGVVGSKYEEARFLTSTGLAVKAFALRGG